MNSIGGLLDPLNTFCCKQNCNVTTDVYDAPAAAHSVYNYDQDERVDRRVQPRSLPAAASFMHMDEASSELVERPDTEIERGIWYQGQWRGRMRHGQGRLRRPEGSVYEGTWIDNRAQGYGVFTTADGSRYEGQWHQDRAHGSGKYAQADGGSYDGQWDHDQKSGQGTESFADGAWYQGGFFQGSKHGAGLYKKNGMRYDGEFRNDKMEGHGNYRFADGRLYVGSFVGGHMNGQGTTTWPNGSKYIGHYVADFKEGEGRFEWPDNRRYDGQWKKGKQHGQGVLVERDGTKTRCTFDMGRRIDSQLEADGLSADSSTAPQTPPKKRSSKGSEPTLLTSPRLGMPQSPGPHKSPDGQHDDPSRRYRD
eukprot:TRINITY_DN16269_c0_g2_i1.p1 TRINITY_DN16269_c0_g2~~TRINITY_DN16269_c0_g2_i1.p1  ORF type:complete len:365 (-),score=27.86 TRINITY_DN16269_c0_g2_i1:193-1287(-)